MANQTDKNVAPALKLALILALSCPAWAGDIVIDKFGGLNSMDSSVTLSDGEASDLLNVNLTPGGKSVKKRGGYGLHKTLSVSTSAVHGAHYFQDLNGSDVQLWGNDGLLNATVSGGSPVQIATGTMSSTWQCADSVGYAYCLTSNRNMAVRTSGTPATTTYQPGIPLGTMLTFTPDRLVVAGVSGNESTLYFSQSNTFTSFTTGVLDASPFTEVISAPGSRITHVKYACGKLLWWKDNSFGYSVGSTQYDLENVTISQNIGTLDNSSDEYNGHVYFRGQDSHIYDYDCSNVTRLSRSITPTVLGANRRRSNSWSQDSYSDFSSGYMVNLDSISSSGFLTPSNASDDFDSLSRWTVKDGSWTAVSGTAQSYRTSLGSSIMVSSTYTIPSTYNARVRFKFTPSDSSYPIMIFGVVNVSTSGYGVRVQGTGSGGTPSLQYSIEAGSLASDQLNGVPPPLWNTFVGAQDSNYHTVEFQRGIGGGTTVYFDGTSVGSYTNTDYSSENRMYLQAFHNTGYVTVDSIFIYNSTATYYSSVHNAPSISSWDIFSSNNVGGTSAFDYYVRASTGNFSILSSTPLWVSQGNGSVVATSTGTYFQTKVNFRLSSSNPPPSLDSFVFNWFEGSAADKSYIKFWDDYVWIAVSSGTSGLNNRIFRWDTNNEAWLIDDIAANGFLVDNNRLYFGSPSAGKVYVYDKTLKTDDSGNINSYWKSKDFLGSDPFLQKNFDKADFIVNSASGTTLSVTYSLDTTSSTVISLNLYDPVHPGSAIVRKGSNLPGNLGYFMNVKFGDNSSNSPWEVMGARFGYGTQPWRPK